MIHASFFHGEIYHECSVRRYANVKIGFIGLGKMGKPLAMNMLKSGAEVIVSSRRSVDFSEFEARGVRTTLDFSDFSDTEIIFLCLPDGHVVQDVLLGDKGLIHHLSVGRTVVDFSTISYYTAVEIAKRLEERSINFLDAPISGMEARAVDGTLTIMCGGEKKIYNEIQPFLKCVGKNIHYMGDAGKGQLTKLINQLLYNMNMAALAEVLPLAVKMGLNPEKVGQVVNTGTGKSHASEFFIPQILKGSFSNSYPLKDAYKDLVSAAEISANLGIPLPVLHAATTTYQMALLRGHGDLDKGAMIRVFEELLGVQYRGEKSE
jgi:3-hydroxyisobutyrate dehydrogenase-like beta-hydroxyacid dehydrogenase